MEAPLADGQGVGHDLVALYPQSVKLSEQEVTLRERPLRTMEALLKAVSTPRKLDGSS